MGEVMEGERGRKGDNFTESDKAEDWGIVGDVVLPIVKANCIQQELHSIFLPELLPAVFDDGGHVLDVTFTTTNIMLITKVLMKRTHHNSTIECNQLFQQPGYQNPILNDKITL